MKVFLTILGLILAASAYRINQRGGYKQNARYIYHYEAKIRPAQISTFKQQFIELLINCTVEIHPVSHEKFFLQISKHNVTARLSDPKFTNGPVDYISYGELGQLSKHIRKPIKFKYRDGMVKEVNPIRDDARFSVNIKKGIINLFHVDINGEKDADTKSQSLFTKSERSIFGKCQTSYSIRDFKVMDSTRRWKRLGFNVTKVIDLNNCTEADFEVINNVAPGPNENQATNPLKSTGTIKYNILGTKDAFKIDEVRAIGLHVLYLTSKDDGGISSVTKQRLKLIKRLPSTLKRSEAAAIEGKMRAESLSMNVKSLENTSRLSSADENEAVAGVKSKMTAIMRKLPNFERMDTRDTHSYLQDVSTDVLHVVQIIRRVDRRVHASIWKECSKDAKLMKWLVYAYSLCGTQECTKFMQKAVTTLKDDDLISSYLWTSSCSGNPSAELVSSYKEILKSDKVKSSPQLRKMVFVSATNAIKTYCRQRKCNSTWVDEILKKGLQNILTVCKSANTTCRPLDQMSATVLLALVENIKNPGLLPHLRRIVLDQSLPLDVRAKAVLAIRPLAKIIPSKVRPLMLQIFRERSHDRELRILSFSVLMDNPSSHVILHIAREINSEPIAAVRRFVHDKWVGMRSTNVFSPQIDTAIRLALELYSRDRLPSRLSSLSSCYQTNLYSRKMALGALLHHEEIYRTNFLPTLLHSKLNVNVLGRNISVLEAQLRVGGLEETLGRLFGPKEQSETNSSKKKPLEKLSELFKTVNEKLPTFSVSENSLKFFTQVSVFDKILHVDEKSSADASTDNDKTKKRVSMVDRLLEFADLVKKLEKGVEYRYSKPFMPVEAIYRMPSLAGVAMTANLTTMLLPVSVSRLTLKTVPSIFSLKMLRERRADTMNMTCEQKLSAIVDVHGVINFGIPNLELGAQMRTTLNISVSMKGKAEYDRKTNRFSSKTDAPESRKEVLTLKRNAYHYLQYAGMQREVKSDGNNLGNDQIYGERRYLMDEEDEEGSGSLNPNNKAAASSMKVLDSTPMAPTPNEPVSTTPVAPSAARNEGQTATIKTDLENTGTKRATKTIGELSSLMGNTMDPRPTSASEFLSQTQVLSTAVRCTATPDIPSTPNTTQKSGNMRVEAHGLLKIPIDVDGLKDVEVIGLDAQAPNWEEWVLKINRKFVSVRNGKVVLSDTPNTVNVTFHGKNQRVVRLSLPGHGFLTSPANNPCLETSQEAKEQGQFFVVTKHGPNRATIETIAHMNPNSVPKDWSIAKKKELEAMEEFDELFQEELLALPDEELDEEEKAEPASQKARLGYLTTIGNSVCLTPMKSKASVISTSVKTSRRSVLRRAAYKNGICYGESFGVKACVQGIRPRADSNQLSLAVSPMEYRLQIMPVSKEPSRITLEVVNDESGRKQRERTSLWTMTVSNKGARIKKEIVITGVVDMVNMNAEVTVTPTEVAGLEFMRLCMDLTSRDDKLSLIASFDKRCKLENLKIDVVSSKTFPRHSMTVHIRHNSKNVPRYIKNALSDVISGYLLPALQATTTVHPSPRLSKERRDASTLNIALTRNDTVRLHLSTPSTSYVLNNVKLPTILQSLPVGTPEIPLIAKMHHLARPQCLHHDKTFVTFDKNQYQFVPRGKCEHTLLRICDQRKSNIEVTTKRIDETSRQAVTVIVDSKRIEVTPMKRMSLKPSVKMNNSPLRFGVRHCILDQKTNKKILTVIWEPKIKCLTVMDHKYDIVVKLTRSQRVSVRVSPLFANRTCGLCGNYNGEKFDDFTTPEGTLVNDVRRPTSFHSLVKSSAATIFASSWIQAGSRCTHDCPFIRKFVEVRISGKVCLTNYRVAQCPCGRRPSNGTVLVPATCVPPSMVETLRKFLASGTSMDLSKSTELLAKVSIPTDCKCKC